jgi:hypothetical protein
VNGIRVVLVWGDPRTLDQFVAFAKTTSMWDFDLDELADRRYIQLLIGPVPISGPVIHFSADTDPTEIVCLVDHAIPEWVEAGTPTDWGWTQVTALPRPSRYPLQVDILVVSLNWSGSLDGWSSSQWCDAGFRPMQRARLAVEPSAGLVSTIGVRILEVGTDAHGVGYVVAFAPDREELDSADLPHHGWRLEPWVRIRRQAWSDLADLADSIETVVLSALGTAIASEVKLHDVEAINADVLYLLPSDVRDALEDALMALPDDPPSKTPGTHRDM